MQTTLPKFSQSVGPGARPPSPQFKPKGRQSLPRPESPLRKGPVLAPTPGRGPSLGPSGLSRSQIGTPRYTPSPGPKPPLAKTPQPTKTYSRTNSRIGSRLSANDSTDVTPTAPARSSDGSGAGSTSSASGFTPITRRSVDDAAEEITRLKKQLEDRDKQLKEQAVSLAEMESSLTEIQNLMPEAGSMHGRSRSGGSYEDQDVAQLRAIIREKNEKISMLTAEFDAHRADFRSTIDTLELASTETERVYEKRVEELLSENRDLQDRGEDVEAVARQLKQLEDLVQELEEGLEDARRGEAAARAEVEFLEGEIERCKAELSREREKSATALKSAEDTVRDKGDSRGIEQRDDEIRGLKAIIHSLSSGPDLSENGVKAGAQRNGVLPSLDADELSRMKSNMDRLEREKKELQGLIERKAFREEELEKELDKLQRSSVISNAFSDKTATQERRSSGRDSKGTVMSWRGSSNFKTGEVKPLATMAETADSAASSTAGSTTLWCEICETSGHDILTCHNIDGGGNQKPKTNGASDPHVTPVRNNPVNDFNHHFKNASISSQDPDKPKPLTMGRKASPLPPPPGAAPTGPLPNPIGLSSPTPYTPTPPALPSSAMDSLVAGKDGTKNPNKWCAICEHDGHDSINCALEDQF
jgi:chromosome segregation ATPase